MIEATTFIAAELEALRLEPRAVTPPGEPFGYGTDLVCVNDITEDAAELDPESTMSIAQDLYHRLITERQGLVDDKDYGFNLKGLLHKGMRPADLAMGGVQVAGECEKDDRVAVATVTITAPTTRSLKVRIVITPEDPRQKEFEMILAVTDAEVLLEVTGG